MLEKVRRLERLYTIEGLKPIEQPIILAEIGSGYPIVAVTAAMHGNEETGVYILDTLRRAIQPKKGTVRFVVANPPALFQGVRFLSEDLNRAFPGDRQGGSSEARLAPKILEVVADSDYTIDLHTTSSLTESFVIVNKREAERLALAEMTEVEKILLIPRKKDYAMIDFVKCGIGIELGFHNSRYAYESGMKAVQNVLGKLGITSSIGQEGKHAYYELFGSVKCLQHPYARITPLMQNFLLVQKGENIVEISEVPLEGESSLSFGHVKLVCIEAEEDFYPIFVGAIVYGDIICSQARKIQREGMLEK